MTTKKEICIITTIFGLIILALAVFVIYPLFNQIKRGSQELVRAKEEPVLLKAQIKELEKFQENHGNYQPNLKKIDNLFIDLNNPISFISFLENTASDCGVLIEISIPAPSKKEVRTETWPSTNFQISLEGSFPGFSKFFERLELSPYLVNIQNLNIRRLTENELKTEEKYSPGDINASFLIKVYTKS
ncbi:MAG: hypothetical protein COU98_02065 [Candidatus Staskawiczbacteria bacterium CG10_big_fil_rev_8_21_14_0_10_38_10]|uniref:Pilus assembly protein PilO n=1 Tax=Candidatus Staskawiczbacteria bacterium CG10_big_fil_rev_8_21_14_0_10_38_10 TaxID=1974891 RepID=A0A2H9T139_9BACT|nr:MAG: hypothetical protein COU98_02065 [Candidatus Staskawiczbacteria bacterium CG10_big_fil_rev_8_21_14_0_10_38_10]